MLIQNTLQIGLDALGQQTGACFALDANGWATLLFDNSTEITLGGDEELGLTMGLPDLSFNEQGCARLEFDGKTSVNLESDTDTGQLQIYTDLCPLPPEGREALYLSLLKVHLFGLQTQGATLAVPSQFQGFIRG